MTAVQGSSVDLPCNVTAPILGDKVRLVLWFKNDSSLPLYTFDARGEARHWSDDSVLAGRAFFRAPGPGQMARLQLDSVKASDRALYKCRVDFRKAPTRISYVGLDVLVPPKKPLIYDHGKEVRLKLGPYRLGDSLRLRCEALGGRPRPEVTWWRDHALLDGTFESEGEHKVVNELVIDDLKREDLHTIFTCQAANNNLSVPLSTSVKLDMNCE